jgi:hypothetical protein
MSALIINSGLASSTTAAFSTVSSFLSSVNFSSSDFSMFSCTFLSLSTRLESVSSIFASRSPYSSMLFCIKDGLRGSWIGPSSSDFFVHGGPHFSMPSSSLVSSSVSVVSPFTTSKKVFGFIAFSPTILIENSVNAFVTHGLIRLSGGILHSYVP